MDSAILAAGESRRLKPLTYNIHKSLLEFLGKPFISYIAQEQAAAGIRIKYIVSNSNYYERFSHCFPDAHVLVQEKPLGTADAARLALQGAEGSLLIQYGDNLVMSDSLSELLRAHNGQIATVGVIKVNDPENYGVVRTDKNGNLEEVIEKPAKAESNLVLAGIYIFEPEFKEFLDKVTPSKRGELELTDALNQASNTADINTVTIDNGSWHDLTYPWDILEINSFLIKRLKGEIYGEVESNVHMEGQIYVGKGSRIRSGSYIEGPVWIGNDVDIGPNAYIRPFSSISSNSRIGNACEVKDSVIYRNVHISHLSYVGDSVIGENTNLGAGTITANLRLDDKDIVAHIEGNKIPTNRRKLGCFIGPNVKTGVNVSINPGIKIGANAYIYPGCVVNRDVGEGEKYKCQP
ncbi:MAG: sugar phosphate nucleotidyltransferase [Candidatus Parvarchaeota archaeon]|nr:sugar phosphate nucleotidyltransferase [Candidatus Rehaiarchaeum fermentans]